MNLLQIIFLLIIIILSRLNLDSCHQDIKYWILLSFWQNLKHQLIFIEFYWEFVLIFCYFSEFENNLVLPIYFIN